MKRVIACFVLLACAAWIWGCATEKTTQTGPLAGIKNPSLQIMTSLTEEAPVSGSFGWGYSFFKVPGDHGISMSAVDERLHLAMLRGFGQKGLSFTESEPDVLVSYAVAAEGEISVDELNLTYGNMFDASAFEKATEIHYKRGVLILDVVNRKSGRLLWRGAIIADLDMSWPEDRKQERCDAAINELLRHYPKP